MELVVENDDDQQPSFRRSLCSRFQREFELRRGIRLSILDSRVSAINGNCWFLSNDGAAEKNGFTTYPNMGLNPLARETGSSGAPEFDFHMDSKLCDWKTYCDRSIRLTTVVTGSLHSNLCCRKLSEWIPISDDLFEAC